MKLRASKAVGVNMWGDIPVSKGVHVYKYNIINHGTEFVNTMNRLNLEYNILAKKKENGYATIKYEILN